LEGDGTQFVGAASIGSGGGSGAHAADCTTLIDLRCNDRATDSRAGGSMTTLTDRPNAALVVIDVQNGVVDGAHERDAVIANISALVERARNDAVPVLWVQHSSDDLPVDSDEWRYVDELERLESEPVVHKRYGDSFEDTDLEERLADRKVGRLIVTGAQTDACVRSTLHGAFVRGYDVTLVGDAHTTEDLSQWGAPPPDKVISHTNLYWSFQDAPGRDADVVAASDVTFSVTD
jgi:hypothetical protein